MCEVQKMPLDGCAVDQTQKAEKYIGIYIDNLVGKFRCYNNDEFVVTISGLKDFVDMGNKVLAFLFQRLTDCNFEINIDGSQKNVDVVEVECKNISKNENYNYKYQIQNLTSIIELSGRTGIPGGRFLLPFFVMDGDNDLYTMAWCAVQFYALSYLVVWIDGTLSSYMTALEKPWHSLSISLLSTFVFPIIMLAVLVPFWGLDGVWILNFAAGILSATAVVIIVKKALKNIENVDLKLVTK